MTRELLVAALALLPLSTVVAAPKVPSAGAAASVTVSAQEAMATEIAAALATTPVAPPALSSKAALGVIVGVAEAYLSTPIVLSLARPRVGNARFTVHDMWRNDPISGDAVFYNDDSGRGAGAYLSFEVIAGQTYVVECAGSLSRWTMVRFRQNGAARYLEQRVEFEGVVRPSLAFSASATETVLVGIFPVVPIDDQRTLSRCQLAKVADIDGAAGAAKPLK